MIQIKPTNISTMQAFRIVDQLLERFGEQIEQAETINKDGLIGVTHYSVNKSKAGNIFVKVWKD